MLKQQSVLFEKSLRRVGSVNLPHLLLNSYKSPKGKVKSPIWTPSMPKMRSAFLLQRLSAVDGVKIRFFNGIMPTWMLGSQ